MRNGFRAFFLFVGVLSIACAASWAAPSRDDEPVLILGASMPELEGKPISQIFVYRWNAATGAFDPIPFQLDPRVDEVFNAGTQYQFTETMYDVFGQSNGLLDDNDELAFLFGDAGPRAPDQATWVAGADAERYEVQVTSSLPGGGNAQTRWAYVFSGSALPVSPTQYVQWNRAATGTVTTPVFSLVYQGNWLLTELHIAAPCGNGLDLIDRVKGRASTPFGVQEDEESWSANSSYLGGIVGPVRAIRYVRGATSGVNTIHHDVIYRGVWRREVNLRVHPLAKASLYIDWLPNAGAAYYSPNVTGGVPVDGVPDSVPGTYVPWTLVRSAGGGLAVVHEVPPSPLLQTKVATYRDDASYDDRIPTDPTYPDDDHSAYGDNGVELQGLADSTVQAILLWSVAYPLCSNVGDATAGSTYRQYFDNPFQVASVPQERGLGAVGSLGASRDGGDVVLSWQAVSGAVTYRIFWSASASDPEDSWTLLGETGATTWRDVGAVAGGTRFYSVVAVGPDGEGGW